MDGRGGGGRAKEKNMRVGWFRRKYSVGKTAKKSCFKNLRIQARRILKDPKGSVSFLIQASKNEYPRAERERPQNLTLAV